MKNIFTFIAVLVLLSFSMNGQMRIGLTGGISGSDFRTKGVPIDFNEKYRATFGCSAEYNLYDNFYLDMKVLYNESDSDGKMGIEEIPFSFESSFIEVPLLLKYEFGNQISPYLSAGVLMSYNLKCDITTTQSSIHFSGDLSDRIKDFNFSLLLGCGLQFDFKSYLIFVEGMYAIGLNNILTVGDYKMTGGGYSMTDEIEEGMSLKNNMLKIVAGVKLPISM